ncbi:MAG: TRAP transporter substrate-binding protein DctP [Betaproteobacteria bacterium]|nr:TRAP transporter substrate-binding protein DctP [Betaproteobacteria bacterium]
MKRSIALGVAAAMIGVAGFSTPAAAQDRISATHVFPANFVYSRSFLEFVKKANEAGKGTFEIQVRGGPEAIGGMQQAPAARDGVVDMVYSACAFYAATVPECDALAASTIDAAAARKNGGIALLDQIHQKRMGVHLLGWVDSGIRFNLWSTKQPKLDAQGNLDIRGIKVRGHPIYNAFLTNYLGAQVITLNAPDVYTALERGTIDLTAWTQIGIMDANWDRYLKFRVDPSFFSTDLVIIVNLKKWQSLSQKSRDILSRLAIEHELASEKALTGLRVTEYAELEKRGLKVVSLPPAAAKRYVESARAASLARMKERMEKSGGIENYERVVNLLSPL